MRFLPGPGLRGVDSLHGAVRRSARQRRRGAGGDGLNFRPALNGPTSKFFMPVTTGPTPALLATVCCSREGLMPCVVHHGGRWAEGGPAAAGMKNPEVGPFRAGPGFSPLRPARPRPSGAHRIDTKFGALALNAAAHIDAGKA